MNVFKPLIGLTFDTFYRIRIKEAELDIIISDSVIIEFENQMNHFQIFTNQMGVYVINLNAEHIILEDNSCSDEILMVKTFATESFVIKKISVYWDKDKTYIIGFVMHTSKYTYYFIRLVDEINIVTEETFYKAITNVKQYCVTEE